MLWASTAPACPATSPGSPTAATCTRAVRARAGSPASLCLSAMACSMEASISTAKVLLVSLSGLRSPVIAGSPCSPETLRAVMHHGILVLVCICLESFQPCHAVQGNAVCCHGVQTPSFSQSPSVIRCRSCHHCSLHGMRAGRTACELTSQVDCSQTAERSDSAGISHHTLLVKQKYSVQGVYDVGSLARSRMHLYPLYVTGDVTYAMKA